MCPKVAKSRIIMWICLHHALHYCITCCLATAACKNHIEQRAGTFKFSCSSMQSCDFESNPVLTCRIETFVVSHRLMVVCDLVIFLMMTENISVYPCILACSASLFLSFTDLKSRLFLYFCLKTGSPLGTVGFQV